MPEKGYADGDKGWTPLQMSSHTPCKLVLGKLALRLFRTLVIDCRIYREKTGTKRRTCTTTGRGRGGIRARGLYHHVGHSAERAQTTLTMPRGEEPVTTAAQKSCPRSAAATKEPSAFQYDHNVNVDLGWRGW